MQRNFGLSHRESKSPCEAETRNTDIMLIVLGGFAAAMWILAWAASAVDHA